MAIPYYDLISCLFFKEISSGEKKSFLRLMELQNTFTGETMFLPN